MGRTRCGAREGQRLGEQVTLGVLTRFVPAEVVDAVLRDTGRLELAYAVLLGVGLAV